VKDKINAFHIIFQIIMLPCDCETLETFIQHLLLYFFLFFKKKQSIALGEILVILLNR